MMLNGGMAETNLLGLQTLCTQMLPGSPAQVLHWQVLCATLHHSEQLEQLTQSPKPQLRQGVRGFFWRPFWAASFLRQGG